VRFVYRHARDTSDDSPVASRACKLRSGVASSSARANRGTTARPAAKWCVLLVGHGLRRGGSLGSRAWNEGGLYRVTLRDTVTE
jgi:hypothetical protein